MKKLLVISLFCLAMSACGHYLDVKPQGYVIPSTDEEFAAIMHTHLQDVEGGADELILGNMDVISRLEACADDLDATIRTGSLKIYSGEYINIRMSDWRDTYEIIRDCNIVIENLDGRSSQTANDVLCCAYAIKGICYYNLIRDFCEPWEAGNAHNQLGVPLVDKFDISACPPRSNLEESVNYAKKLLQTSIDLKMERTDLYIFGEYITKCYLARLLFWAEDWSACASLCEDILDNSGYSLTSRADYADVILAQNARKGEVILRSHINNASELDWYFAYVKGYIASRPASAAFVRTFGDERSKDVRFNVCLDAKRFNAKTPECRVRISEFILMLAECRYHLGQTDKALVQLNALRKERVEDAVDYTEATLPALREGERIVVDATGKAVTPLLQAIFDERRKELFMEGSRWYELKRNGRPEWWVISNGLKYTTKKYMYTAPVYKGDVDSYDIIQNEGYN